MNIEIFELERTQSVWENRVQYNLTESGIHPFTLNELLNRAEIEELLDIRLGYGQTNGSIELRQAISNLYSGTDIDNILVTNGSAEANFVAIWSLLTAGDEMVLMLPNYMQIWGIARGFRVSVKSFHLREELKWTPDFDELKKMVSPKTKVIAVCNPNNPTGSILRPNEMQEIVKLAQSIGAWIYADEIYRGAELDGHETPSFWGLYDKVLVCGGLSKAYALPGLQIGWLAGPEKIIEECWAHRDYTSIATGILGNRIAVLALQSDARQKIFARNRKLLQKNLAILSEWVTDHPNWFRFVLPKAAGIAFLHYQKEINSTQLANRLRDEKSVLVIAGDCFGMDHYIRLGIGAETHYFTEGLRRVEEMLQQIF